MEVIELSPSIKCREFLYKLRNYQIARYEVSNNITE
jgi:hypothetical protein